MNKLEKEKCVTELKEIFANSSFIVLARNLGINVAAVSDLRRKIKTANGQYKVAKNSLMRLAAKNTNSESLMNLFVGPTSIAYANEPIDIAKILVNFSKKNKNIELTGAIMDGNFLAVEEISKLASLPSLDELRSKLISLINAPATKIAAIAQEPTVQLIRLFKAYTDKKQTITN